MIERQYLLLRTLILMCVCSFAAGLAVNFTVDAGEPAMKPERWQSIGKNGQPSATIIYRDASHQAFFFLSGMRIDADGSPRAYHPRNIGLDSNQCAMTKERQLSPNVVHFQDGKPYIQQDDDPAPGYYLSMTSLTDRTKPLDDAERYVNAEVVPYIALPLALVNPLGACEANGRACLGDLVAVINTVNGCIAYAIVADVGPAEQVGEGSIALARKLRIFACPRKGGEETPIVAYIVFPRSGDETPCTAQAIADKGRVLFAGWGGAKRLLAYLGFEKRL